MKLLKHHIASETLFVLAVLFGVSIRFYQITTQILIEDELHSITALIEKGYLSVLMNFGKSDYCIPLTFFYKIVADTIGLSEIKMHVPVLLCGIATLILLPLLTRGYIGKSGSILFAWLLAISPMHILYSRIARPYCISTLLAFIGIVAFYKWWAEKKEWMLYIYIPCAVLGPYFHLTILPFVLTPVLISLCLYVLRTRGYQPRSLKEIVKVSLMVLAGLTILLLGPVLNDSASLLTKTINCTDFNQINLDVIRWVLYLTVGTKAVGLVTASLLIGMAGIWLALRQKNHFLLYLLCLSIVQILFVQIVSPAWICLSRVLFRYYFTLVPVFLIFLSFGLTACEEALSFFRKTPILQKTSILLFVILLFIFGPLKTMFYEPNQWISCSLLYGFEPETNDTKKPPVFYNFLGSLPREKVFIVEAPWFFLMDNALYRNYQKVHRQKMGIGFINEVGNKGRLGEGEFRSDARGLEFAYFFHLNNAQTLLEKNVSYLILHKNLKKEMEEIGTPLLGLFFPYDIKPLVVKYTDTFGEPVYEDAVIIVFRINGRA